MFYLNPRRFVDTVRYRIYMIETHLRTQERNIVDEYAFECKGPEANASTVPAASALQQVPCRRSA